MNRPCVALTNNPGLKWKNPTPEPCAKPQTEMYQPPNPEPNPRLPGLGSRTYRVSNSGHPNPETRGCRVTGIGCPELGTRSEFRTPDTRDPAVSGFGVRVSGTRNLGEFGEIKSI
ncbi:hypothetical protein EV424DRAFT_1346087 [Suillus variegatus]|nr:hypothetical protein EV424DRAFT_1346087 [Suillus variegatus]